MPDKTVRRVVGLQYDPEAGPPRVVLKSAGVAAQAVLDESESLVSGPALVQDEALLQQLYRLPLDAAIDPSLYELVAILLAQVYAADAAFLQEENNP
ncbi:flagellar protein FhlB [Exilibacterium tricleocarpae]|uniref:flagellar protein FhlB n=1 Tax=Exilibacterium tricleocarpae TaxID=2591008 RepID=UPI0015D4249F|nr:flagellar protein FhlB [Exilibacterium tricleocarpae]